MQGLESNIETTTAALRPPAQPTSQPAEGTQTEEEKKGGGKGGKGAKDKGDKVCQETYWHDACHTENTVEYIQGTPGKKGKQTPAKKGAPDPTPPIESPGIIIHVM